MEMSEPGFRPLYAQVRARLLERLISGGWAPGTQIPSEFELAADLGVSQGTVRKAINSLAADNILVRYQGKGTFVSVPEEGGIQYRFFRLVPDEGEGQSLTGHVLGMRKTRAGIEARERLNLPAHSWIWEVERTKSFNGVRLVSEQINISVDRFPDLDRLGELSDNLFSLYSLRYGLTVAHAIEKLKAAAADRQDAGRLGCKIGTPLLAIDRIAYGLDQSPVEWRLSRCLTEGIHYHVDLR